MALVFLRHWRRSCVCFVIYFGWLVNSGCSRHAGSPSQTQTPADVILATVGDENITVGMFSAEMASRRVADEPGAKKALLDEMIQVRLLAQEARRRGYDHDPEVENVYDNLLANRVRQDFRAQAKVSPQEIEAYYTAHPAEFTSPAAVHAAIIFVEAPAQLAADVRVQRRATMDSARQKALALPAGTAGFGTLAAEYSYDQATKYHGGDAGFLVEGSLVQRWEKPVLDAAFTLSGPDQLSDVITTGQGYYLIKLIAKRPSAVRSLDSVRLQIERRLTEDKEHQLVAEVTKRFSDKEPVKTYDDRLAAIPAPKPANRQSGGMPPLRR